MSNTSTLYQDLEHGAASHYIFQVVFELGYDSVPLPKENAARRPACFPILSLIFAGRVTYTGPRHINFLT